MNLEEFLRAHHYTVAALSVLGTFSAVAVALFSSITALRASKTRISAGHLSISFTTVRCRERNDQGF